MMRQKLLTKLSSQFLKLGLAFCCCAGLLACGKDDSMVEPAIVPVPGVYDISMQVDTLDRKFKLIIPSQYDHTSPRPLLICLHGGNLSMGFMFNNRKDLIQRCDDENWILVFPNGANPDGNSGASPWKAVHCCGLAYHFKVNDVGFMRKIVDTLSVSLKIDASRIYAMGGSNGGMLSQRLAGEMADVFAAAAANQSTIGGQVDSLSPVITVQPTQPIPIIMIHGLNDTNVNYFGGKTKDGNRIDISFHDSVLFWADNNQCSVSQADTTIVNGLNGKVWIVDFNNCDANTEVKAITIENKGHGWPGLEESGFDGTNAMVDFLKQFSK